MDDKPAITPRKVLAEAAKEHYEELAKQAGWHNSIIPEAIDAWERERALETEITVALCDAIGAHIESGRAMRWSARWKGAAKKYRRFCNVYRHTAQYWKRRAEIAEANQTLFAKLLDETYTHLKSTDEGQPIQELIYKHVFKIAFVLAEEELSE